MIAKNASSAKSTKMTKLYPAANPKQSTDLRETYSRTVKNVLILKELGALPDNIVLICYDNEANIGELMLINNVCWHKSGKNSVDHQKMHKMLSIICTA